MAPSRPGTRPLPASIRTELNRLSRARRRNSQAIARAGRARTLADTRAWAVERRARTRHLIELGGLVQKAGLFALTDDDLRHLAACWRRRGLRAFDANSIRSFATLAGDHNPLHLDHVYASRSGV